MPRKRQPESQMLWLEITACTGRRWLHAADSPHLRLPVPARSFSAACVEKEGEGILLLQGCVFAAPCGAHTRMPSIFPGKMGEVRLLCAFTSNRTLQSLPHLVVGHRGVGLTSGQVSFPPPCSSSPCPSLFSAPLFNRAVYSSPNF